MSTLFSVTPNDDVRNASVQNTAVCLSLSRKHLPFDERERIKKRRKQLNPVRLSLDYVRSDDSINDKDDNASSTDSSSDKHITYSYTAEPSTSAFSKSDSGSDPALESISVPLNLTKNSRVESFINSISSPVPETSLTSTISKSKDGYSSSRIVEDVKLNLYAARKDDLSSKYIVNPSSHSPSGTTTVKNQITEPIESPPNYEHFLVGNSSFHDETLAQKDQSPPFSPRTPPVSVMRSLFTNAVTRTSCRIFNPEAFCNICNKEFCNKYFLKTHKANKHGVYCETKDNNSPSSAETNETPSNPVPLMFTWNVKNNNVKLPSNPYLINANAVKDSSAFCNICEKEFCNKYFLRRHKEKMHGIVSYNDSRKSDTSSDSDNKTGKENDDGDRDLHRISNHQSDDSKPYPSTNLYLESKSKNELNQNSKCNEFVKNVVKDGKLKYPKYSTNMTTDAVSDFLKICLTNTAAVTKSSSLPAADERLPKLPSSHDRQSREINAKHGQSSDEDLQPEYSRNLPKDCDSSIVNLIIKKEHPSPPSDFNCQPNISVALLANEYKSRNQLSKCNVSTGEFGVQAKEEDFHDMSDKPPFKMTGVVQPVDEFHQSADDELDYKKYQCELCSKKMSTFSIMKLHHKYVHAMNVEDTIKTEGCIEEAEFKKMENIYFMILKFSLLNTVVTFCEICKTEFDKNDVLEMHLMNKHGALVDEISRIIEDAGVNGMLVPAMNMGDGNLLCQICNKTFTTNASFQQHVYEKCGPAPDFKDYSEYFPSLSLDDSVCDSSKTRNFCEICKKELCNKYFMKTHMHRMHGISLQNGVRIGGVTCEICNKELCSKYFLRVHKKNCHGIMENVTQFVTNRISTQQQQQQQQQPTQHNDIDKDDYLAQKHVSQICSFCGRIFKSMKWLKTHLFNDHGKIGAARWQDILNSFNSSEQESSTVSSGTDDPTEYTSQSSYPEADDQPQPPAKLYQCSSCQFQTSNVELLITHQRLHLKAGELQYRCMYCFVFTKDKNSLEEHIAYHHFTGSNNAQIEFNHDSSPFDLAITNGNCARVIDYDRSN
ncbi:uncharacterized protein LOC135844110 [Planococcus citri]|uniref:uncharacterized protein LOC135844110 n=1 Tax=Planococcus citri TaxID=170843 RepID=UPI0031FA0AC8